MSANHGLTAQAACTQAEGQIGSQLSKMENELDNLHSISTAMARRLLPVTGMDIDAPVPTADGCDTKANQSQVPLAERIHWLCDRLNHSSNLLEKVLNRIEI